MKGEEEPQVSSVADPYPDPVRSGLFGHPKPDPGIYRIRIRILYPQKNHVIHYFLVIKLSKIQFRPNNFFIFDFKWHNNFLSLILSVIGCLDLVRKCPKKYLFC